MRGLLRESNWTASLLTLVTVVVAVVLSLWPTAWSLVDVWLNSETYSHGFIILPISLWLIWERRAAFADCRPLSAPSGLPLVLLGMLVWALAYMAGIQVVSQLALIGLLVMCVVIVVGWKISLELAFPLLFLFLAVPLGEDLVPPLMEFTASFTVGALQLTGVPVYREGLWFSLPSGNWSVVEACSGVRYLIASVTLGFLYAYLSYRSLWKRTLFVALSAAVPILANGVRAYIIVMIGHLSDMQLATGVDHLIYGWIFFGIVMLILFWLGSFWQDARVPVVPLSINAGRPPQRHPWLAPLALVVLVGAVATLVYRADPGSAVDEVALTAPDGTAGWRLTDGQTAWSAPHLPASASYDAVYAKGEQEVQVFVRYFSRQLQGSEAVGYGNHVEPDLPGKGRLRVTPATARDVDGGPGKVNDMTLTLFDQGTTVVRHFRAWQWYRIADRSFANPYIAKFYEVLQRLRFARTDGAWIAVVLQHAEDANDVDAILQAFVRDMVPRLEQELERASPR